MKKINFLSKLLDEGKLELVESSEEIKESYLEKANSNLFSAKLLIQNDCLEEAVSLAYYSMYHLVTALFFKIGIKCENHAASIILLKKIFSIDNQDISLAKKERIDKQYYVGFKITEKEVKETIIMAEHFNAHLFDFISKLNTEEINKYRNIFKDL